MGTTGTTGIKKRRRQRTRTHVSAVPDCPTVSSPRKGTPYAESLPIGTWSAENTFLMEERGMEIDRHTSVQAVKAVYVAGGSAGWTCDVEALHLLAKQLPHKKCSIEATHLLALHWTQHRKDEFNHGKRAPRSLDPLNIAAHRQ